MLGSISFIGSTIMVLILCSSLVWLTVVIERCWRLLPLRRAFPAAKEACDEALLRNGRQAASTVVQERKDPMERVLAAGLGVGQRQLDVVRVVALDAAQREVVRLERGLGILMTIAQVAPLLGLLGTVFGLIEAFAAASTVDQFTSKDLSGGIYAALGTTAAGLVVAIPAYISYNTLSGYVGRLIGELEHAATDLPVLLAGEQIED